MTTEVVRAPHAIVSVGGEGGGAPSQRQEGAGDPDPGPADPSSNPGSNSGPGPGAPSGVSSGKLRVLRAYPGVSDLPSDVRFIQLATSGVIAAEEGKPGKADLNAWLAAALDVIQMCVESLLPGRCFVILNPSVQRQDHRVRSQAGNNQRFVRLRTTPHALMVRALQAAVSTKFPDVSVIDFFSMSVPHWEATWDGVHYSKSAGNAFKESGFTCQWQGGASFQGTLMFLYELCLPSA